MTAVDGIEALVGYVYVVGGRAVSAIPPGALVETPPRKAQRSREQDTFFTLITPYGSAPGQASIYEQLARMAGDVYFRSTGSVTSGLREAFSAVNAQLLETGQRRLCSMIALVLRGHEVYSARAGSCLCLLRQGDQFFSYPERPADDLQAPQLGSSAAVDIKLSRYEIAPGHIMMLADAGFSRADLTQLREALGMGSIPAIVEPLKALGGKDAQAMIIEFASTDTPDPAPLPQKSTPVRKTDSMSAIKPSVKADAVVQAAPAVGPTAVMAEAFAAPQPNEQPGPVSDAPVTEMAEMAAGAPAGAAENLAEMAVTAEPAALPSNARPSLVQRVLARTSDALGGFARGLSRALDRMLPEPAEEGGPRIPAMMAAALAILVPVVVVFVVVALRLSQFDLTQFEQLVLEVEQAAKQAELIPLDDVEAARTAWLGIIQRIDLVETNAGRTNDPTLVRIRAKAQGILDTFDKVTRRTLTPLRSFGEGAKLVGPVIRSSADVYLLDASRSAIYRDTLSPVGGALLTRNAQPVVQQGQSVGAFAVRNLVDILWMSEGGIQRANVLAALDTQGILVSYSPTFAPATAQRLAGSDLWQTPVAATTWRGRLYILDAGANQIWRYIPVGNAYPNPPEEYFSADNPQDLSTAVDLAIDTTGNVYILFADGRITQYTSGVAQPAGRFGLRDMPGGTRLRSASAMYLDNDSQLPAIYILDPVDSSVYVITLSGTFLYRFKAVEPGAFNALSGIFVDGTSLYVASGQMLYYFSIADVLNER